MNNGFTVETIVAQIRSRIAEENARKSSLLPAPESVSESPSWDVAACLQRMEEDTTSFEDLDLRIENAARNIGQQPLAPPTWRGRLGAWIIHGIRRLLWWYGVPIKEVVAQIGLRNREQAIRHRNLQKDLLALSGSLQRAVTRIDGLEQPYREAQNLQWSIADCRTRVALLGEQVESRLNGLQKSQDSAAKDAVRQITALNDQVQQLKVAHDVLESLRTNLATRVAELASEAEKEWKRLPDLEAQQKSEAKAREALVNTLEEHTGKIHHFDVALGSLEERIVNDIGRAEHATNTLNSELRAEMHAREVLAGLVNSQGLRIEQVNGALVAQLQTEMHAREVLAGVVNGQSGRIEQVNGALAGQLQAEMHAREILAGVANAQGERIEQVNGALAAQLQAEMQAREVLTSVVSGQADKLQHVTGALEPLASLPSRVSSLAVTQEKQRSALLVQENRIAMFLREVRQQLPKPLSKAQVQQFTEAPTDAISALYADFEDTFRGPRELIKGRQKVYVPLLKEAGVGSSCAPVLDLGCGRGEWLELLAEHHLVTSGVDSNPGMIERCRALDLNVTLGDSLTHLRGLPNGSVGAVTSFHMVEHLPFETVIALVDEALRVLRSGGVLILETPNPQNVLTGSHTFWIDPTHLKPIPSSTLRFFVEARGFCDVEIWNLQPYPEAIRLPEDRAGIAARFNDYFYGAQDYGIVARRP